MDTVLRQLRRRLGPTPNSKPRLGTRLLRRSGKSQGLATYPEFQQNRQVLRSDQGALEASSGGPSDALEADLAQKRTRGEGEDQGSEQEHRSKRRSGSSGIPTDSEVGGTVHDEVDGRDDSPRNAHLSRERTHCASVLRDGISTLALFLSTEDMKLLIEVLSEGHKVSKLAEQARALDKDIDDAEPYIEACQIDLQNAKITEEHKNEIRESINETKERKKQALVDKEKVAPKLDSNSRFLAFIRRSLMDNLQEALVQGGLMQPPREDEDEETENMKEQEESVEEDQPAPGQDSLENEVSIGELRRQEARDAIVNARIELGEAEDAFAARHYDYCDRFDMWAEARTNHATSDTRTDFDVNDLRHCQELTRNLINAENAYREAKRHAKEVHSQGGFNSYDRDSIFFDQLGDGYYSGQSEEGGRSNGASQAAIEYWVDNVVATVEEIASKRVQAIQEGADYASMSDDCGEMQEADPHVQEDIDSPSFNQARSLSFAVSIGDIDKSWRRRQIDEWNAICGRDR